MRLVEGVGSLKNLLTATLRIFSDGRYLQKSISASQAVQEAKVHRVNIEIGRRGVTSIEYALIVGLIAVSLVGVLQTTQSRLISTMMRIADALPEYTHSLTAPGNSTP